jgi:hypothetical protein
MKRKKPHPMKRSYVVFLLICLFITVVAPQGASSKVETDQINGAPFRIEMPANWRKRLVNPRALALRNVFLSRGFAVAE